MPMEMQLNLKHLPSNAAIVWLVLLALRVRPVLAQSMSTSQLTGWMSQSTFTGDWGGVRTYLENLAGC